MFGFLNLLLAAAIGRSLLQAGAPATDVVATLTGVLDAGGAAQVVWEPTAITWLGHRVDLDGLAAARRTLRGFGSCSFDEPVAELRSLGLL
jgi:hypothetical protein